MKNNSPNKINSTRESARSDLGNLEEALTNAKDSVEVAHLITELLQKNVEHEILIKRLAQMRIPHAGGMSLS